MIRRLIYVFTKSHGNTMMLFIVFMMGPAEIKICRKEEKVCVESKKKNFGCAATMDIAFYTFL